jgi:hypothetical protein
MIGAPTAPPARHAFGVYLGAVQLFFTLCWTAYVIYLPKLAAQAGIDRTWVPRILVLDQVIFSVCDWSMGVAADRASAPGFARSRLGRRSGDARPGRR